MNARLVCASFLAAFVTGSAFAADSAAVNRGRVYFNDECAMCHAVGADEGSDQGPSLTGVVGRKAGAVPGFDYSKQLKASGKIWTPQALDKFLADPPEFIQGTKMPVNVGDAKDRADLIAFLASNP